MYTKARHSDLKSYVGLLHDYIAIDRAVKVLLICEYCFLIG
jgi:hypothetical protein